MEKDEEKGISPSSSSPSALPQYSGEGEMETVKTGTTMSRFRDSFKRNPNARMITEATDAQGRPLKDQPPAEPALAMKLKNRHVSLSPNTRRYCFGRGVCRWQDGTTIGLRPGLILIDPRHHLLQL